MENIEFGYKNVCHKSIISFTQIRLMVQKVYNKSTSPLTIIFLCTRQIERNTLRHNLFTISLNYSNEEQNIKANITIYVAVSELKGNS